MRSSYWSSDVCSSDLDGETLYMGSLPSERYFPGIERLTPLLFLPDTVLPRIWIGHASHVACHYDMMDNVACVQAGDPPFPPVPPPRHWARFVLPSPLPPPRPPAALPAARPLHPPPPPP